MATRNPWNFALKIKGATRQTLDMGRLGEYLTEFARLIGPDARPRFAGMVDGSVVLRAFDRAEFPAIVRSRIRTAPQEDSPAHRSFTAINSMMERDGVRGDVVDRTEAVLIHFPGKLPAALPELQISIVDTAELDGQVVAIVGSDDTVHVRLQEPNGTSHRVVVREIRMAQELAKRFRTGAVRITAHGTWLRDADGRWRAETVYADSFVDLDESSASDILTPLKATDQNGWSEIADPMAEWSRIRGLE